jgi:PAS domain S-box-containing protein
MADSRRLLIVEDDPEFNALVKCKLQPAGLPVESVLTGAAALDSVRRDPNVLLLLDYVLPDMTARELVERLRADGKEAPFVVMTGRGDEKVAVELMKLGARDYLVKDSDLGDRLPEVVRRVLGELDIQERLTAAEAMLLHSEQPHRLLLEHAGPAISYYDANGRLLLMNHAAAADLSGAPADFVGKSVSELFGAEAGERILKRIAAALVSEQGETHEDFVALPSGDAWYLSSYRRIPGLPGASQGVQIVSQDITERKQDELEQARLNEVLKRKNEELEQHIYVVSHDLRTPLVSVQGFVGELKIALEELSQLLAAGSGDTTPNSKANSGHVPTAPSQGTLTGIEAIPAMSPDAIPGMSSEAQAKVARLLNEDIPTALRYILAGTEKMSGLLAALLRLSRLGRAALKLRRLDMNRIAEAVVAAQAYVIQQTGGKVELEKLPPCRGDAQQVSQVLANLLSNAINYRDPARPLVVKLTGQRRGRRAAYCVEDNGIGIAPELQRRVYDLFYRVDPHQGTGDGLGLTIVQRALARLGGEITLESEPGKGSRFCFTLPVSER